MDFFPVSVWYGPERCRAPMVAKIKNINKVKDDIIQIKKLGFNSIRFWYDWLTAEPKPDEWDFETIDTLLTITDEVDIKTIVQIYTDSAPSWISYEYPDSLFVDRSGLKVQTQASPGVCSDHPKVKEHISMFLEKIANVVSSHPSFFAWDIWSEPHIVQWSWIDYMNNPWFCYCEHSQNRFRKWLENKYTDIDSLNNIWYRRHRNWEEITSPRYSSLSVFTDLIDWITFNIEKISEDLEWKVKTIKNVDNFHLISSHAAISSIYSIPGIGYGSSDDWKLAEKVDVWGTSFYPKHTGSWMPLKPHQMGVALDATKSSSESKNKQFWIGELQSGLGVTGLDFGAPVTEKDLEKWAWLAISRNAKGLNYYAWNQMNVGYEVSGFGLTDPDGSINEKANVAGQVSKIITKYMKYLLSSNPIPSQIAIFYSIDSYKMIAALRERSPDIIRKDMFGIYKSMMEVGINVDFINTEDLLEKDIEKYKVIFAPFLIALSDDIGRVIMDYVQNGGTFVAEGRGPWVNEKGELTPKIPGAGLHKMFGCTEIATTKVQEDVQLKVGELNVTTSDYLTFFNPSTAEVISSFEEKPVILKNSFGSGVAYIIGTIIGKGYEDSQNSENIRFFANIARESNVIQPYNIETDRINKYDLEIRLSSFEEGFFCFVFNHSKEQGKVKLSFNPKYITSIKEITEIKSDEKIIFTQNNDKYSFSTHLEPEETKVFLLMK